MTETRYLHLENGTIVPFAHRGWSGRAPEHTGSAFRPAIDEGYPLEIDFRLTADRKWVALHDHDLWRTARGHDERRWVARLALAELRRFDYGSWFNETHPYYARTEYVGERIVAEEDLGAVVAEAAAVASELKVRGVPRSQLDVIPDRYLDLLGGLNVTARAEDWRILVSSFSPILLLRIHELAPHLPLVQLLEGLDGHGRPVSPRAFEPLLDVVTRYAVAIGPAFVDRRLVEAAHRRGLAVLPYAATSHEDHDWLAACRVDGVFSNHPDRTRAAAADPAMALRILAERRLRHVEAHAHAEPPVGDQLDELAARLVLRSYAMDLSLYELDAATRWAERQLGDYRGADMAARVVLERCRRLKATFEDN